MDRDVKAAILAQRALGKKKHEEKDLRDWFAGQALCGIIQMDDCNLIFEDGQNRGEAFAQTAYIIADAMLKVRAK